MVMDITWDNTRAVLDEYAKHIVEQYRRNLAQNKRDASRKLSDTVSAEVIVGETVISIELTLQDYYYYAEHGRKAGKMPPISKIEQWIKVKPVKLQPFGNKKQIPSPRQVAYLIARKIGREGTKGTHDLQDASDNTFNAFKARLEQALAADVGEYVAKVFKGEF